MCGIFFAFSDNKNKINDIYNRHLNVVKNLIARGPDRLSILKEKKYIAIHTHLKITGDCSQPIDTEDFVLIYNGEIYNDYLNYNQTYSDADYLCEAIKEKGLNALYHLDGEYAVCLYNKKNNSLIIGTDVFGTKPLYYAVENDLVVVSSYESPIKNSNVKVKIKRVKANTIVEIDLNNYNAKEISNIISFDFNKQTGSTYDSWIEKFEKSLTKRTSNPFQNYFVSFSAGHDSGLIAAEMLSMKKKFRIYYSDYMEDKKVLGQRLEMLENNGIICTKMSLVNDEYGEIKKYMEDHLEPYLLINSDTDQGAMPEPDIKKIPGFVVACGIYKLAREQNQLISLSGQGADEIVSDYYNEYSNSVKSELRGNWNKVDKPWRNLFGGWNQVFLGASERIAGLYGVETRYPFLDRDLVQEYINLDPKLKMKEYKAPISERLRQLNFAYHGKKQGFAGYK